MEQQYISENAGKIRLFLTKTEEISLSELGRKLELRQEDIILAVGWLAREDKIIIRRAENDFILFNCEAFKFSFG